MTFVKLENPRLDYVEEHERTSVFLLLPSMASGGALQGVSGGNIQNGFRTTHFSVNVSQEDLCAILKVVQGGVADYTTVPKSAAEKERVTFQRGTPEGAPRVIEIVFPGPAGQLHLGHWYLKDTHPAALPPRQEVAQLEGHLLHLNPCP